MIIKRYNYYSTKQLSLNDSKENISTLSKRKMRSIRKRDRMIDKTILMRFAFTEDSSVRFGVGKGNHSSQHVTAVNT